MQIWFWELGVPGCRLCSSGPRLPVTVHTCALVPISCARVTSACNAYLPSLPVCSSVPHAPLNSRPRVPTSRKCPQAQARALPCPGHLLPSVGRRALALCPGGIHWRPFQQLR